MVLPPQTNQAGDVAVVTVIPASAPQAPETENLVHHLRDRADSVAGGTADVQVTGTTAALVDVSDRLSSALFPFIGVVLLLSIILLTIVFRSIVVPIKAAVLNVLSIAAAYGVVVAVFQWGWGNELLGVGETIPIAPFVPMMMFAVLFGLSMDYEVFILSRIRESWQETGDPDRSVIDGLSASGRVVTAAAVIMASVFASFLVQDNTIVKLFGLGLATAVLLDATIVRMVLVPTFMKLLGAANWWVPSWLDRILPHVDPEGTGLSEGRARPDADVDLRSSPNEENGSEAPVGQTVSTRR